MRTAWLFVLMLAAVSVAVAGALGLALTRRLGGPSPEPIALHHPSVRLHTVDGEELGATFLGGMPDKPILVLLHGNLGSRAQVMDMAEAFSARGYGVLAVTARAHGDSTGHINDIGWSARLDVVAAVMHLEAVSPGRPVFVLGRSMGAAAAVFAAPQLGTRVRGYILDGLYADLSRAMRHRVEHFLPWRMSVLPAWILDTGAPLFLPNYAQTRPIDAMRGVSPEIPILMLTGSLDWRAPVEDAREIQHAAPDHTRLIVYQGGEHDQLFAHDPGRYLADVTAFVAATLNQ